MIPIRNRDPRCACRPPIRLADSKSQTSRFRPVERRASNIHECEEKKRATPPPLSHHLVQRGLVSWKVARRVLHARAQAQLVQTGRHFVMLLVGLRRLDGNRRLRRSTARCWLVCQSTSGARAPDLLQIRDERLLQLLLFGDAVLKSNKRRTVDRWLDRSHCAHAHTARARARDQACAAPDRPTDRPGETRRRAGESARACRSASQNLAASPARTTLRGRERARPSARSAEPGRRRAAARAHRFQN